MMWNLSGHDLKAGSMVWVDLNLMVKLVDGI